MADTNRSAFPWSAADLPRGDFGQSDSGNVILPYIMVGRPKRDAAGHVMLSGNSAREARPVLEADPKVVTDRIRMMEEAPT